jgi:disulfide oxidoreductase YuzD
MISEKTLKKWQEEAFKRKLYINSMAIDYREINDRQEEQDRILCMIQELLDQHLLRKGTA